jgi:hypothetical protein
MASLDRKNLKRVATAKIRAVEQILRRWDPIGVEPGVVAQADEYDSYAPHIVSMVEAGCTVDALAAHLEHLATCVIGLGANEAVSKEFAGQIVEALRSTQLVGLETR